MHSYTRIARTAARVCRLFEGIGISVEIIDITSKSVLFDVKNGNSTHFTNVTKKDMGKYDLINLDVASL